VTLRPLPNFILVRPDKPRESFGSIIVHADNGLSRVSENTATVIAVPDFVQPLPEKEDGKLVTHDARFAPPVVVGDRVIFRGFLADVNPVGDDMCLIHHGDILAVVQEGVDVGPFSKGAAHGA